MSHVSLIRHRHGNNVKFVDRFHLVGVVAHAEHLYYTLIGAVVAIFRAAVALGYPHRLMSDCEGMTYILRQQHRMPVELPDIAARAFHFEHAVALADVDYKRRHHQVGTERYLSGFESVLHKHHLQQTRIEHDVAVIRHIEICFRRVEIACAVIGQSVSATLHNTVIHFNHRLMLKIAHTGVTEQTLSHGVDAFVGINKFCEHRERNIVGDPTHCVGEFRVIVRTHFVETVQQRGV